MKKKAAQISKLVSKKDSRRPAKKLSSKQPTGTIGTCGTLVFSDITKIHPALKSSLGYCLFKASSIYRAKLEENLRVLEINVHHLAIISVLSIEKSTNQNQMCDELGVDKASMVKLIDHLEKQKLVERIGCSDDRRVKFVHVTDAGMAILAQARKIRDAAEAQFLAPLTEAERANLKSALPKLIELEKKQT